MYTLLRGWLSRDAATPQSTLPIVNRVDLCEACMPETLHKALPVVHPVVLAFIGAEHGAGQSFVGPASGLLERKLERSHERVGDGGFVVPEVAPVTGHVSTRQHLQIGHDEPDPAARSKYAEALSNEEASDVPGEVLE